MLLAYSPIFGKPLIFWTGILGLLIFLATFCSAIAFTRLKLFKWLPWHKRFAWCLLFIIIAHAILGILTYV